MRLGFVGTGRASAADRVAEPSSRLGSAMTSRALRKRSKPSRAGRFSLPKRKIFALPDDSPRDSPAESIDDARAASVDRGSSADRMARRNSTSTGRAFPAPASPARDAGWRRGRGGEGGGRGRRPLGVSTRVSEWFASSKSMDPRFGMKRSLDGVRTWLPGLRGVRSVRGVRGGVPAPRGGVWPVFTRFAAGLRGVPGVAASIMSMGPAPFVNSMRTSGGLAMEGCTEGYRNDEVRLASEAKEAVAAPEAQHAAQRRTRP